MEPYETWQPTDEYGSMEGFANLTYDLTLQHGNNYEDIYSLGPLWFPLCWTIMEQDRDGQFFINPSHEITQDHIAQVLLHVGKVRTFEWKANRDVAHAAVLKVLNAISQAHETALPLFPALDKIYFDDSSTKWLELSVYLWGVSLSEYHCRMSHDPMFNHYFLNTVGVRLRIGKLKKVNLMYTGLECPLGAIDPNEPPTRTGDEFLERLPWLEHIVFPFFIGSRGLAALARREDLNIADIRIRDLDVQIDEQVYPGVIQRGFRKLEHLTLHLRWREHLYYIADLLSKMRHAPLRSLVIVVAQPPDYHVTWPALDHVVYTITQLPWAQSLEEFTITAPSTPEESKMFPCQLLSATSLCHSVPLISNLLRLKIPLDIVSMSQRELLSALDTLTQSMNNLQELDLLPTQCDPVKPTLPIQALHVIAVNCKHLQSLAIDVDGEIGEGFLREEQSCLGACCPVKFLKVGLGPIPDYGSVIDFIRKHFPCIRTVASSWDPLNVPAYGFWSELGWYAVHQRCPAPRGIHSFGMYSI